MMQRQRQRQMQTIDSAGGGRNKDEINNEIN
jgi:hypothetical protein